MTTLALECSTAQGSLAALRDGRLIFSERFTSERGHGSALFVSLERALAVTGRRKRVVVGLGPGSYSGIRIAIAAAIGLEVGHDSALLGIPSVAALETSASEYIAIGDARRGQFFFARAKAGLLIEGPELLSLDELNHRLAAAAPLPVYASAPIPALPDVEIARPSAEILVRLAESARGITATDHLEPLYLREPHITQPKK